MPTETQLIEWLWINFPSVAIGCSIGIIYIALYLRLRAFLERMDKTEKQMIKHSKELLQVKEKLAQLIICHCKVPENKADMDILMRFEREEE